MFYPSIDMNGPWKIYFETKGKSYMEFVSQLSESVEKCIWYFHPNGEHGKGPHVHALIYDFPRIDDTMRGYIKKEFNLDGRKQEFAVSDNYEKGEKMTHEKTEKYITYMSKGKFEPFFFKGYEKSEIEKLKEKWIDYKKTENKIEKNVIMNIEVHKKVKLKITRFALAQQVLAMYTEAGLPEEWSREEDRELVKKCVQICNENQVLPHYRAVAEIAQAVKLNMEASSKSAYIKCLNMV